VTGKNGNDGKRKMTVQSFYSAFSVERNKERKALPILQLNFISFNILPVNIKHGNSSTLVQKYLLKKLPVPTSRTEMWLGLVRLVSLGF
jgi:hypothetical protein